MSSQFILINQNVSTTKFSFPTTYILLGFKAVKFVDEIPEQVSVFTLVYYIYQSNKIVISLMWLIVVLPFIEYNEYNM